MNHVTALSTTPIVHLDRGVHSLFNQLINESSAFAHVKLMYLLDVIHQYEGEQPQAGQGSSLSATSCLVFSEFSRGVVFGRLAVTLAMVVSKALS